jgi:hypothetical protein
VPNLAGDCEGCARTFGKLDALLDAAVDYEVDVTGHDRRAARLHVLAAVESWWLDRSLGLFLDRARGLRAVNLCLLNVFREQGIEL